MSTVLNAEVSRAANGAADHSLHAIPFPEFTSPAYLQNGHLQTVVGAYLPYSHRLAPIQHRVTLSDGDVVVLHDDRPAAWQPGDQMALLLHGLAGCHQSSYMVRVADKLAQRGVRTWRMDHRGVGAGVGLARKPYHAGRSQDALDAVRFLRELEPQSPIALIGFSMSGNIVLKLAGEQADRLDRNIQSLVAVAPPIDLNLCADRFQRGANPIYGKRFVRGLIRRVDQQLAETKLPEFRLPTRPRSLFQFDDIFTSRVSGFANARDYYAQSSSNTLLARITVPTLILAAEDDPMIPSSMFSDTPLSSTIRLHVTRHGGHLGFVGRPGIDGDRRWMDWRIVDWVTTLATSPTRESGPALAR